MKKTFSYGLPLLGAAFLAFVLIPPVCAATGTTTPVTPPTSAPVSADHATPDSVTAGDLIATHPSLRYKKDYIDVFFSIKNTGSIDETVIGAGSSWTSGDVVAVKKDKDGKETEMPISIVLPAGKTTDFSDETTWIRVKDIKTEPKSTDIMPFEIYTRRSPKLVLKIPVGNKASSGSFMDWLKK